MEQTGYASPQTRLEWFNGNADALALFEAFVEVAHLWDDLIDKDKEVTGDQINRVFTLCLTVIPYNPVFRMHQDSLKPLIINGIAGYLLANKYEEKKDEHGIELAHTMRYAVSGIFMYLIVLANGYNKGIDVLEDAMKDMICERFAEYQNDHLKG